MNEVPTSLLKIGAQHGLFFASILLTLEIAVAQPKVQIEANQSSPPNITTELRSLGNKPKQAGMRGLALNIWDMVSFDNKIFIGMGNTTTNAGPIPIWAFDLTTQSWDIAPELILPSEAIERFRVINGDLYIPAADPKPPATDKSKFYRRQENGTWTHYSSQNAMTAHIRDLALYDNWLIGVGNSRTPHKLIAGETGTIKVPLSQVERFSGGQWPLSQFESAITTEPQINQTTAEKQSEPEHPHQPIDIATTQRNRVANWFFSTFELHDGLYASTRWMSYAPIDPDLNNLGINAQVFPPNIPPFPHLVRWSSAHGEWIASPPNEVDRLIPECADCDQTLILYPHKPILFGELWWAPIKSYGLGGTTYRSAYNQSAAFIVKPADGPGQHINLPYLGDHPALISNASSTLLGEAVWVEENYLYVLANAPIWPAEVTVNEALAQSQSSSANKPPIPQGYQTVVYRLPREKATEAFLDEQAGFDPTAWLPVLEFTGTNPVRSFLKVQDDWYFGLGVNSGEPTHRAGELLLWQATRQATDPAADSASDR